MYLQEKNRLFYHNFLRNKFKKFSTFYINFLWIFYIFSLTLFDAVEKFSLFHGNRSLIFYIRLTFFLNVNNNLNFWSSLVQSYSFQFLGHLKYTNICSGALVAQPKISHFLVKIISFFTITQISSTVENFTFLHNFQQKK